MKIQTKQIDDENLVRLLSLYIKYCNSLGIRVSNYSSMAVLTGALSKPGAVAFGLYRNNKLIGFTLGWSLSSVIYYFDALYILPRYRIYIKRLYLATEDFIQDKYCYWMAYASKDNTIKLHKRMGAKIVSIEPDKVKFIKEI